MNEPAEIQRRRKILNETSIGLDPVDKTRGLGRYDARTEKIKAI